MRLKTEYTYNSGASEVTVIIYTDRYTLSGEPDSLKPEQVLDHVEAIHRITGCPKAPTDKEMEEMEEYFNKECTDE